MRRTPLSLDAVRELAAALPGVEESTSWGAQSWKVRGKMMACQAINKSAEPNSLGVMVPFEQRDELIAAQPDVYYVTDHYVNYPCVLVRLSRVHRDALRDLLGMAARFVGEKAKKKSRPRKRAATPRTLR
jgi:hypothetical protein